MGRSDASVREIRINYDALPPKGHFIPCAAELQAILRTSRKRARAWPVLARRRALS